MIRIYFVHLNQLLNYLELAASPRRREGCLVGDGDHGCQFWPQSGSDLSQNETNQIVQITF